MVGEEEEKEEAEEEGGDDEEEEEEEEEEEPEDPKPKLVERTLLNPPTFLFKTTPGFVRDSCVLTV